MSIITSFLIATLFVPQGSDDQILNNPLENGEIAYVNGSTGESFLHIGQSGNVANRVVDESALRGYQIDELDRSLFVISAISNLTRDVDTDTLKFTNFQTGVTNTFIFSFSIPNNVKFDDVSFYHEVRMQIAARYVTDIKKIVSGNTVTVIMSDDTDSGVELKVSDFKVLVKRYGDPDYVNDLTKKIIVIHDTASEDASLGVGDVQLGQMRQEILHRYDKNRGEDRADYKAPSNVKLFDKELRIGNINSGLPQMSIRTDAFDTNVVSATFYGRPMINYYREADTSGATGLSFLSIDSSSSVSNTFTLSVTGTNFDASNLRIYESQDLDGKRSKWTQIPFTLVATSPAITIRTQRHSSGSSFFRLSYGNEHVVVHIADTLKVDRFLLKGDNGSYYRIGVNSSGVLTATIVQ